MRVTAKAKLGSKFQTGNGDFNLQFYPDYYGDKKEINKEWATSTPSLSFQLIVTEAAAANFEQGKSYLVTFEPDEENTDVSNSTA